MKWSCTCKIQKQIQKHDSEITNTTVLTQNKKGEVLQYHMFIADWLQKFKEVDI